jgi:fructosamine-3-kinase
MLPLPSPVKLTAAPLRLPLEAFISAHLKRTWTVKSSTDLVDLACHPATLLSDGSYPVFAKFSAAPDGFHQFEVEVASLKFLSERAGVLVPTVVGILPLEVGAILVFEEVHAVERTPRRWRQIGQALACLHMIKGQRFGLENDVYIGPLPQDNTPADDWVTFYRERRLLPGLKMAVDSGNLPDTIVKPLERLITRLPDLCGPTVAPCLLHGDAQQNNYISAEAGAFIIDPAIYFGHPEMDLAWLEAFAPVPREVYDGYRDLLSIDPGFCLRRPLWRLWGYLAAVTVEGLPYLGRLVDAVRSYA